MGIPGIYQEIGPGERIALCKLAIEKLEKTGRPLRIAIDISIWQFQHQAGKGGSNPALRTLYYRTLRLLSLSIQPIFVFDGPNKPPVKRNKRTNGYVSGISDGLTRQILELFGIPIHTAPGEAEAECALLQREGIVDAVLSEDVDTLMFGCGLTLRNWSSENRTGNHSPTHVSLYDSEKTKGEKIGLDREGMVLVALMSGGDYNTDGLAGCGIKVACEAARAGFGTTLCRLSQSDTAGMNKWRKELAHELQTNEQKFFRVKHKALRIPDDFPDRRVLGYYTHPVVSSPSRIKKLKDEICWDGEIDVAGLRTFVANAFNWTQRIGAEKLIRGLAPVLLIQKLRRRSDRRASGYGDVVLTAMNEMELVRSIVGRRQHFDTDGVPELRVVYCPADIVGIDLDAEPENETIDCDRNGLAPVGDNGTVQLLDDIVSSAPATPAKKNISAYDPTQLDRLWIPETIVKLGVPLKAEDYAETLRAPKAPTRAKSQAKKITVKSGMPKGAIERFVQVTKPVVDGKLDQNLPSKPSASSIRAANEAVEDGGGSAEARTASLRTRGAATRSKVSSAGHTRDVQRGANPWAIAQISDSTKSIILVTKSINHDEKPSASLRSRHRKPEPSRSANSPLQMPKDSPKSKESHEISPTDSESGIVPKEAKKQILPQSLQKGYAKSSPRYSHRLTDEASHADVLDQRSSPSPSSDVPTIAETGTLDAKPTLPQRKPRDLRKSPESERSAVPSPPCSSGPSKDQQQAHMRALHGTSTPAKNKQYVIPRESLPGSWKIVDEIEYAGTTGHPKRNKGAWRMSDVERLDLTGN